MRLSIVPWLLSIVIRPVRLMVSNYACNLRATIVIRERDYILIFSPPQSLYLSISIIRVRLAAPPLYPIVFKRVSMTPSRNRSCSFFLIRHLPGKNGTAVILLTGTRGRRPSEKTRSSTKHAGEHNYKGESRVSLVTRGTQKEHLEIAKDEICSSLLVESGKLFRG